MRQWLQTQWLRLLAAAERRLPALTRLRQSEPLPITLDRRRIYVLPTASGLALGGLLAALALGALNYDNNPALILCFLLASAAHTSLLQAFLSLRGLRLVDIDAGPVHAGEPLQLRLHFLPTEQRARAGIVLRRGDRHCAFDLPASGGGNVQLTLATERRGWLAVGRIALSVRRPLGLFVAWSWLHPQLRVLVYPRAESPAPPLPDQGSDGAPQRRRGPDEDIHGLRDYRSGDPLRTVAWKRSAQLGRLQVREFESPRGQDAVLDWAALAGLDYEARIRRLTRWVLEAERRGLRSELRLPGERIGPGRGEAHLHACLSRLATLPAAEAGAG